MKCINAALCSYGMSGQVFHGPLLETHEGFKITKILERRKFHSEGKHPGARLVRSYEEILSDPEVELVVVNTPDPLHYEMCMAALEAGKHLVVEKPFVLNSAHGEELMNLAQSKGRMLSVFQNRRWDGDFLTVKEVIDTGRLGRLVDFESHFDRYRTEIKPSWKDRDAGTGTMYNLGSHLVDQALQLFGMPERLYADIRSLRDGALTDDSYDLFLHYPGHKCLLRSSYLVREAGPRFILHGTAGSLLVHGIDPQEEALKEGKVPEGDSWGHDPQSSHALMNSEFDGNRANGPYGVEAGNYLAYYDNIHSHLTKGEPLAVTARQALDVVRIIEASYLSSREGRVINL